MDGILGTDTFLCGIIPFHNPVGEHPIQIGSSWLEHEQCVPTASLPAELAVWSFGASTNLGRERSR
jgi:hypothetical protein